MPNKIIFITKWGNKYLINICCVFYAFRLQYQKSVGHNHKYIINFWLFTLFSYYKFAWFINI